MVFRGGFGLCGCPGYALASLYLFTDIWFCQVDDTVFNCFSGCIVLPGPLHDSPGDGLTTSTRGNSSATVSILHFLLLSLLALLLVSRRWSCGSVAVAYALLVSVFAWLSGRWLCSVMSRLSLALVPLAMLCWSQFCGSAMEPDLLFRCPLWVFILPLSVLYHVFMVMLPH